ncbi:MAG: galactose-1-phosphate uridylyltransferase [bacterium]
MNDIRECPYTGRQVVISESRGDRPHGFGSEQQQDENQTNPFLPGNEDMTPDEVYADRPEGGEIDDWRVRIVPNKFPAVSPDAPNVNGTNKLFTDHIASGHHDVVIETPNPNQQMKDYSGDQIQRVFKAWSNRLRQMGDEPATRYTFMFKNHGEQAGASLPHPHSQLISLPVVPRQVKHQVEHVHHRDTDVLEEYIEQAFEQDRVVSKNNSFVCFSPYVPIEPYETWILPRKQQRYFHELTNDNLAKLGQVIQDVLNKTMNLLGSVPYNLVLSQAPLLSDSNDIWGKTVQSNYRWHLMLLPRVRYQAGFEYGTGMTINQTSPETSARDLRNN